MIEEEGIKVPLVPSGGGEAGVRVRFPQFPPKFRDRPDFGCFAKRGGGRRAAVELDHQFRNSPAVMTPSCARKRES
jgi:hypothetical protein